MVEPMPFIDGDFEEPSGNLSIDDRIFEGISAGAFAANAFFIGGLALRSEYFYSPLAVGGMMLADVVFATVKTVSAIKGIKS
jgi:hypothetical protein